MQNRVGVRPKNATGRQVAKNNRKPRDPERLAVHVHSSTQNGPNAGQPCRGILTTVTRNKVSVCAAQQQSMRGDAEAAKTEDLLADLTYAECPEAARPQAGSGLVVSGCRGETLGFMTMTVNGHRGFRC